MNTQLHAKLTALLRNYASDLRVRIAVRHDTQRPPNVEDMLELTQVEATLEALAALQGRGQG